VTELISSNDWEKLFPDREAQYSYEAFLQAVAQYPYFCNEFEPKIQNLRDVKTACKRELSTLLAHMIYESGNYTADDYDGGDCEMCYDGFNWDATKIDQGLAYGRDVKCNKKLIT